MDRRPGTNCWVGGRCNLYHRPLKPGPGAGDGASRAELSVPEVIRYFSGGVAPPAAVPQCAGQRSATHRRVLCRRALGDTTLEIVDCLGSNRPLPCWIPIRTGGRRRPPPSPMAFQKGRGHLDFKAHFRHFPLNPSGAAPFYAFPRRCRPTLPKHDRRHPCPATSSRSVSGPH